MVKIQKDLPSWNEKDRCPMCNSKLVKRHEGMVCPNFLCPLYFKCETGWVYLSREKTREEMIVNEFWNNNSRLRFLKQWNELRAIVLKRDNYTCQKCNYKLSEDFFRVKSLNVHHIVPASKESALYLDEENLITFCIDCHKLVHLADKYKFGESKQ